MKWYLSGHCTSGFHRSQGCCSLSGSMVIRFLPNYILGWTQNCNDFYPKFPSKSTSLWIEAKRKGLQKYGTLSSLFDNDSLLNHTKGLERWNYLSLIFQLAYLNPYVQSLFALTVVQWLAFLNEHARMNSNQVMVSRHETRNSKSCFKIFVSACCLLSIGQVGRKARLLVLVSFLTGGSFIS